MKKFSLLSVVLLFGIVVMLPARAGALLTPDLFTLPGFSYGAPVPEDYDSTNLWDNFIQWPSGIIATHDGNPELNLRRGWANDGTTLTWLIAQNPEDTYTYTYTWYTYDKDLSHIIIELTDDIRIPDDQIFAENAICTFGPFSRYDQGNSNPGMPEGGLYGIKIDLGDNSNITKYFFSFTVDQAPVWGNFYAKDGDPIYAYNTGFADPDNGVFIPRPNGFPVPEPGTMLLLGAGLIGLATVGRKKFLKRV